MAEHMDKKNKNVKKPVQLREQQLLLWFTILAEGNDQTRIQKTQELLNYLLEKQSHLSEGICDEVEYSVKRLVQGLASSRKFARLGYSVALCQVLRCVESLDCKHVLGIIHEKSKQPKEGQTAKSEITHALLGQTFGYLSLIHSGKLFSINSKKVIPEVVKNLQKLSTQKTFLHELCINGIISIIAQVKSKTYKKKIFPHIEDSLKTGWSDCTPDTLLLAIISNKYHSKVVKDFVTEHWLSEELVCEENFPHIADIVMKLTQTTKHIHPVVDELISAVLENNLDVLKFWEVVVCPSFEATCKGKEMNTKVLGLHMFNRLLPVLDTTKKVEGIMSPHITGILIHYSPNKNYEIKSQTKDVLDKLQEIVKATKDPAVQIAVVKSLVQKPGSFMFDTDTKTTTLATIMSSLVPEAVTVLVKASMKTFTQQTTWITDSDTEQGSQCGQWCVKQIGHYVTSGNQSSSWKANKLQFMFLHSFCKVTKTSGDIPHCTKLSGDIPEMLRKCVSDNFFKTICKLMTVRTPGVPKAVEFGQHLDILVEVMEYGHTLVQNTSCVQIECQDFSPQALEEWNKLIKNLHSVNKKRQSEDKIGSSHAFLLLFINAGLQLFREPDAAIETIEDLLVCYKKSTQKRKSMAKDDGPEWMDVITELLLSLMFKDNALSRTVAKVAMTTLADHVTKDSLQLILDALKQTSLNDEEGAIALESDEEDADADMDEADDDPDKTTIDADIHASDSSSDEDDSGSEGSGDEDQSDIEEEAGVTVEESFKNSVKNALGEAAAESSDDDSEGDNDFTDNQMFKLDHVLVAAFKSMRKGKKIDKEKEKQLRNFKSRVLDLLEVIIKQHPGVELLKNMLVPLLNLVDRGERKTDDKSLGTKALGVYQTLCATKKTIPEPALDGEEMLQLLATLMKYSAKVPNHSMVSEVGKGCIWIIQVLLNIQDITQTSPLKTRSKEAGKQDKKRTKDHTYYQERVVTQVQDGLTHLFSHKPGSLPPAIFHALVMKYPLIFWSLWQQLTKTISSLDVRVYERTQAATLLSMMISKQLITVLGGENEWEEFVTEWRSVGSKVIEALTGQGGVKFVQEVLSIYVKVMRFAPEQFTQVIREVELTKLESIKSSFNGETKSLYRQLDCKINSGQRKQHKKEKKDKKRKKKEREAEEEAAEKKMRMDEDAVQSLENNLNVVNTSDDKSTPNKKKKHSKNKFKPESEVLNKSIEGPEMLGRKGAEVTGSPMVTQLPTTPKTGNALGTPKSKKKKHNKGMSPHAVVGSPKVVALSTPPGGQKAKSPVPANTNTTGTPKSAKKRNMYKNTGATLVTNTAECNVGTPSSGKKAKLDTTNNGDPNSMGMSSPLTGINGARSPPITGNSSSKNNRRQSHDNENKGSKNKFSPRYTRSMIK